MWRLSKIKYITLKRLYVLCVCVSDVNMDTNWLNETKEVYNFKGWSLSVLKENPVKHIESQWIVLVHGENENLYFCFVNA